MIPGSPYVDVVCTDASHEGRTARVHRFVQHRDVWDASVAHWPKAASPEEWQQDQDASDVTAVLEDDERVSAPYSMAAVRARWSMTCKLCGLCVVVREDTLTPLLDKLAASGVSVIQLGHLARIVTHARET